MVSPKRLYNIRNVPVSVTIHAAEIPRRPNTRNICRAVNHLTQSPHRSRNRVNGATQTFRRPSLATNASNARDGTQNAPPTPSANTGVYIPPHLNSNNSSSYFRNGISGESRFNKDQMIDIYKAQRDSGVLNRNLEQLFSGGWNPFEQRDEAVSTWDKRDKGKDQIAGPEICWNHQVDDDPLSLLDMTDEEKEVSLDPYNPRPGPDHLHHIRHLQRL
jgi:PERQ amino acid-rich with GYF domain-containing protein